MAVRAVVHRARRAQRVRLHRPRRVSWLSRPHHPMPPLRELQPRVAVPQPPLPRRVCGRDRDRRHLSRRSLRLRRWPRPPMARCRLCDRLHAAAASRRISELPLSDWAAAPGARAVISTPSPTRTKRIITITTITASTNRTITTHQCRSLPRDHQPAQPARRRSRRAVWWCRHRYPWGRVWPAAA
jgi:hypothetical protein